MNCYISEMEKYYLENNILSRFCLLLIMFLDILLLLMTLIPTSKWCFSLQILPLSMDSGVTAAFEAYCLRRICFQAIAATEKDTEMTLMQSWKDYDVYDCIKNLAWTWGDVSKECINSIWNKILRDLSMTSKALPRIRG